MIDDILREYASCSYDFRRHSFPEDDLESLFGEWIEYYRMKWAISKVLQPKSILEIGVRYGYSARAFLDASLKATYIGLDADVATFGGRVGALAWAEQSMEAFDARFIKVDTQTLTSLPGQVFDLIHVDGQQDGDGTFHDLNLALSQARFILVDGYFWTRENFLAVNEWMFLNKAAIQWAITIPGYAGDLLIKAGGNHVAVPDKGVVTSEALANFYTKRYYLTDCGGFAQWQRDFGKSLSDPRLRAVAEVAWALATPTTVIDLGAGRGELTRHFAKAGVKVTAVDYSQNAVALVEQTLQDESLLRAKVNLICGSVTNPAVYDDIFDVAVASDIVEHLSPPELDALYKLVAQHLEPNDGIFVVHTAPNLWHYLYEHARQRRAAKAAGGWLPRTRRTYYERLMHINEQSPRVLKKQLMRYFPHVAIWFAGEDGGGGSLSVHYRIADMRRATNLFAVASRRPIPVDVIRAAFRMEPLPSQVGERIALRVVTCPEAVKVSSRFKVRISLTNGHDRLLSSNPPNPLHISYHWESSEGGSMILFDGQRSTLIPACQAGTVRDYDVAVLAPSRAGRYALRVVPVQEGVRWHESANDVRTLIDVGGVG
jgi:2-polyprenyl-3-methyl-5-hydroxy-6-metoxy-1,4-benzoquinol methylase